MTDPMSAPGCFRPEDNDQALTLVFSRPPTDVEMRMVHDFVNMMLDSLINGAPPPVTLGRVH